MPKAKKIVDVKDPVKAAAKMAPAPKTLKSATRVMTTLDYVKNVISVAVKKVVTHFGSHADEALCFLMLTDEAGREVFPNLFKKGFKYDEIEFRRDSNPDPKEHESRPEALFLGFGRSPFDEHQARFLNGEYKEAACTLLARHIGLNKCPWWEKTIEDVRREDRHGGAITGEISFVGKTIFRALGRDDEAAKQAINFMMMAYWAETEFLKEKWKKMLEVFKGDEKSKGLWESWYAYLNTLNPMTTGTAKKYLQEVGADEEQQKWFANMTRCAIEFEKSSREEAHEAVRKGIFSPVVMSGQKGLICAVESDNTEISDVCWGHLDGNIKFLVVRSSTGHTAILSRHGIKVDLSTLATKLGNSEKLGATWYLPHHRRCLLNGNSERFSEVTPTSHSASDVVRFMQKVLDDECKEWIGLTYQEVRKALDS